MIEDESTGIKTYPDYTTYIEDDANFANLFMVQNTWAVPFVTNKRYNIRWGTALDFETMNMHLSDRWLESDH